MIRSSLLGLRIQNQLLDELEKHVILKDRPDGKFNNMSECIRECAKLGLKLLDYQEMIKDPKQAEEFQKKMKDIIKGEEMFEWTHSLTEIQIEGFLQALDMERNSRYENTKLL